MNSTRLASLFAALFGVFLGLALLKFGNPPIMEKWVEAPTNVYEFLLGSPWPIAWAYRVLFLLTVLGFVIAARGQIRRPQWIAVLPLLWLVCQVAAAAYSVDDQLSWPTLKHFAACVVCFYLGLFALARADRLGIFWAGLLVALLLVIMVGWQQRFGGLEATRQYFFREIYPQLHEVSAEYLKKLASNRIFSTLFYPNSLAGVLLLLGPLTLHLIGRAERLLTLSARCFLAGLIAIGMLACLYWSGSKGGWLLMLLLALTALLRLPFRQSLKYTIISVILVAGLSLFLWKYIGFFQKGATSVSARFDYWEAALKTANAKPLTGTGPGTFSIPYKQLKRPESEMARLVHNDYLEQASDSGWGGFCTYTAFIIGALFLTGKPLSSLRQAKRPMPPPHEPQQTDPPLPCPSPPEEERGTTRRVSEVHQVKARTGSGNSPTAKAPTGGGSVGGQAGQAQKRVSEAELPDSPGPSEYDNQSSGLGFSIWLGVLGWAMQGLFDFGLYIPALAWPAFTFLGLLLGRIQIPSTKGRPAPNLAARHENPVPQRA